jgi:hypothetical protein
MQVTNQSSNSTNPAPIGQDTNIQGLPSQVYTKTEYNIKPRQAKTVHHAYQACDNLAHVLLLKSFHCVGTTQCCCPMRPPQHLTTFGCAACVAHVVEHLCTADGHSRLPIAWQTGTACSIRLQHVPHISEEKVCPCSSKGASKPSEVEDKDIGRVRRQR